MAAVSKQRHNSGITSYLGPSAPLPVSDLPTLRDVLKQCQLLREQNPKSEKDFTIWEMSEQALALILPIWTRANVKLVQEPIRLNDNQIARRIKTNWEVLAKLAGKQKVDKRQKTRFEADIDRLFSILTCECQFIDCIESQCNEPNCQMPHIKCSCPLASKIPRLELSYIKDQRQKAGTKGCLQMDKVDKVETARQLKGEIHIQMDSFFFKIFFNYFILLYRIKQNKTFLYKILYIIL